ncbi:Secondary metabolism regulator laeA [Lasiodiplodia hormozganensis]|uniref:Secondary metabolism regulator laeA n=1 Tax=Lasiodiplodia hormozganensis TaxID=869390 RepID=A0AA39Z3U4_9PEZI|nr:Secondary metabolism regulator laeA [Lasiodiplodia hormozganensis]
MGDATVRRPASRASSISSRSVHSTRSLLSTDLTHVVENGRTYPNDTYYMPCDGLEQTRLEILHRLYLTALDGALTTAPLPPGLQRVLDVGTGPGEWASQMAEQFPDAEIVAVDLAVWELPAREASDDDSSCDEIDPRANIVWEIDDLEPYSQPHSPVNPASPPELAQVTADVEGLTIDQGYASGSTTAEGGAGADDADGENKPPSSKGSHRSPPRSPSPHHQEQQQPHPKLLGADLTVDDGWNFSEPFDFVHMRDLKGAFRDWRAVYREAFVSLAPGGLLEVVEIFPDLSTFAASFPSPSKSSKASSSQQQSKPSAIKEIVDATVAAAEASGRPLSLDHLDEQLFIDAGFCDVQRHCVDVPMGPWPDDPRLSSMGKMWLVCCAEGLEAGCLRLLTRYSGWDAEDVKRKAREARREMLEGRCGGVVTKLWFVTARKAKRRAR